MGLGLAELAVAAALYPGGTWMDRTRPGHSLWFNFVCDLVRDPALNGRTNPTGSGWGRAGVWTFALALAVFWWVLPSLLGFAGVLPAVQRTLGLLSSVGLLAVPATIGTPHAVAVFTAAIPGLGAGGVGLGMSLRGGRLLQATAVLTLVLAAADTWLYARGLSHPAWVDPRVPIIQRLAFGALLCWMTTACLAGRRKP